MILARLTAERGMRTVLFRLDDRTRPRADTLRNQAWLQSGLRYVRADKVLATKMWVHGRRLHEFFGLRPPNGRGVIQVSSESEAADFHRDASELGLTSEVRELQPDEASGLLGPLHQRHGVAFETPESPFEEATLLAIARESARAAGAQLRQVDQEVEIVPMKGRSPSHRLRVAGQEFDVGTTVLAAGAGNIPLLAALGSGLRLKLRQTPILVFPGVPLIKSPILLDRSAGLSVIAHPVGTCRSDGCMVVGTRVNESVTYGPVTGRFISARTQRLVFESLPACMQSRFAQARFTAGWEPIPAGAGHNGSSSRPWVETLDDHPDVLVSLPGRATLALHAAETAFEMIERSYAKPEKPDATPSESWPGTEWREEIFMHHEQPYDGLNDVQPS